MAERLGIETLAEGVETEVQAEICRDLGFDLAQGYLYGRPQPRQFWQRTICSPLLKDQPTEELSVKSREKRPDFDVFN